MTRHFYLIIHYFPGTELLEHLVSVAKFVKLTVDPTTNKLMEERGRCYLTNLKSNQPNPFTLKRRMGKSIW